MKKLVTLILMVMASVTAFGAQVKISDLPLATTPSTNTFIEIADMNAATKSSKYLLTNLATVARVSTNAVGMTLTGTNVVATGNMTVWQLISLSGVGRFSTATNYTVGTNVFYVAVTSPCKITLPAANAVPAGHSITIKDSGSNMTTNSPAGSDTLDGVAESDILTLRSSIQYVSDGVSNWERN